MCNPFGGKGPDPYQQAIQYQALLSQQQAAAEAAKRQATIEANTKADQATINQNFGQFNDDWYNKYRDAYTGYYSPQVQKQYTDAVDQEKAILFGRGTLESSVGAKALADLAGRQSDALQGVQSNADNAVNSQRQNVSAAQNKLTALAQSGADPATVSAQSAAQAGTLSQPQQFASLGSVFSDLVTPFANYTKAAVNSPTAGYASLFPQNSPAFGVSLSSGQPQQGGGSSYVVSR